MRIERQDGRPAALDYEDGLRLEFPEDWDLFLVRLRDDAGRETSVHARDMTVVAQSEFDGGVRTHLERNGLIADLIVRPSAPEARMTLEVENNSGLELVSLDFPRLPVCGITPEHALYFATPWGSRNFDPVSFLRREHGGEAFRRYPADLAMQYTMICGGGLTHYLSAYNLGDETFEAWASVIGDDSISLANRWYPYIREGRWSSPENGIALLRGDWHAGADLYRDTFGKRFKRPDLPDWIRNDFHGWVQSGLKMEDKPPERRFADIVDLYRRAQEVGLNVIHLYGWSGRGFDTMYPDYDHVHPDLGTEEEFRAAIETVRAMGGRVEIYTNGRLVDPDSEFYKHGGCKGVIVNEDGSEPTEKYGTTVHFKINCPGTSAYREHFKEQLRWIITHIGPHGVQIDQVSCNPAYFCFSKDHEHSKPSNNWIPGTERFLIELREMYRALDPEFYVWIEGMHERFGQHYDINQGQTAGPPWNIGEPFAEQFKFTYPDYVVTGPSTSFDAMCHTFIQGKPFDIGVSNLSDERLRRTLSQLVATRRAEPDYFLHGIFRDTAGIEIEGENVQARAIKRRDEQGVLVNLWAVGALDETQCRAIVSGQAIAGSPRVVYPEDAVVSRAEGRFHVRWTGPLASVAWE